MTRISTHVLDAVTGAPARRIHVSVSLGDDVLGSGYTDEDGRITDLVGEVGAGVYRIRFDTGAWFTAQGTDAFYPEIVICFQVTDVTRHHHVPVLLSPFAYSTYRGS